MSALSSRGAMHRLASSTKGEAAHRAVVRGGCSTHVSHNTPARRFRTQACSSSSMERGRFLKPPPRRGRTIRSASTLRGVRACGVPSSEERCADSAGIEGRLARQAVQLLWNLCSLRVAPVLQRLAATLRDVRKATSFSDVLPSNGKSGLCLCAALFAPGNAFHELLNNQTFMATFLGWGLAQLLKVPTHYLAKGKWRLGALFDSGGMPSSHSALCMAITTSIVLQYGLGSSLFPLAFGFSLIVMYDAAGVRRHAGKQAEVINKIVNDMFEGNPHLDHKELKEVLGHTPIQVVAGGLLGVMVAYLYGVYGHPIG